MSQEPYIDHSMKDLLTQRILQVACGYEDANDSNTLRAELTPEDFKTPFGAGPDPNNR